MKKIVLLLLFVLFSAGLAVAQVPVQLERPRKMKLEPLGMKGTEKLLSAPKDKDPGALKYKGYSDESLDEMEKQMQERDWGSEDTAWKRACEQNTYDSYQRYIAMYPNGAHKADATCLLIDARVNEALRNAHENLPNIHILEADPDSPNSTLRIRNNTGLTLTVYCSGNSTKDIVIPPDGFATLLLENGEYKIAASVPPQHIRPFAGKTTFTGGSYDIGFWVVNY